MSVDDRDNVHKQAAGRFIRPESDKEQRLLDVKDRLTVGKRSAAPTAAASGGWLLPALFWTAFIGLGTLAASYWVSVSRGSTAVQVMNGDALELRLGRSGHYEVTGSVASQPARFIVDTGASLTSIPSSLGQRIGIRECSAIGFDLSAAGEPGCCRRETFSTANGTTEGCVARVPAIRFGGFELKNAKVAVMPDIGDTALLGMNVLRHFRLVQQGSRLTVSAMPGD